MPALTMPKLRSAVIKAGVNRNTVRGMSRDELEAALDKPKPVKKKAAVKKAPARSTASRKPATRKAPARKSSSRTAPARKASTKPTATRKPANKPATRKSNSKASDVGWRPIEKLSFTQYDKADWNPRPESGVGIIFKALKTAKGNREAAYKALLPNINKLAPKTSRLGNRRTAQEQRAWLKYRINQTLFNFARATGQHESGTNRKPYNGNGQPKRNAPARARAASKGTTSRKTASKTTAKAKSKPATRKPAQGTRTRRRTTAGRK